MAITALFSFLQIVAAFIYWATGFLGTYSRLQAGALRCIRQVIVPACWIAKISSVFETSVMWDQGSNCHSATASIVGLEQASRPLSASFLPCKTWKTIPVASTSEKWHKTQAQQLVQVYPADFKLWVLWWALWFLNFTSPEVISLGELLWVWKPNVKLAKRSHSSGFIIKTLASFPAGLIPHLIHFMCKEIFQSDFTGVGGKKYIYTHVYIHTHAHINLGKICFPFLVSIVFC